MYVPLHATCLSYILHFCIKKPLVAGKVCFCVWASFKPNRKSMAGLCVCGDAFTRAFKEDSSCGHDTNG